MKDWLSDDDDAEITYGFKEAEFSGLPDETKFRLLKLMARIHEKAYRRGFEQGGSLIKDCPDIGLFRCGVLLDYAPDFQFPKNCFTSAMDMLFYHECWTLPYLGFEEPPRIIRKTPALRELYK